MKTRPSVIAVSLVLVGLVASPGLARAVDLFEIQVYEGDINPAGRAGLELHSNLAVPRPEQPDLLGTRLLRTTFEPSFGLLEWWEVGAYFQIALHFGDTRAHFGGFKLRSKWVVPRRLTGSLVLGLNVEIGRGGSAFGDEDWDSEFRPILVWMPGRWLLAANPLVGWTLSGNERGLSPDFEPAFKVRRDTGLGFGVGVEYYTGLGRLGRAGADSPTEQILYLVADLIDGPVDLNAGIGRGLTAAAHAWTFKAILGVGF